MKARYLKRTVVDQLWDDVPNALEIYRAGAFSHLASDASTYFEATFDVDENRFAELQTSNDAAAEAAGCKVLVEAIPNLRPYEARDERFWAYLTHTVLLPYCRARWAIPEEDEKAIGFIRAHFFARGPRGFERENAASRLWWMGHLCRRISGMTFDEALDAFLYRSDVRANIIERPTLCQNAQIFTALLKALRGSAANDGALFERSLFRPLMVGLNSAGGARLLDCMPEAEISKLITTLVQPLLAPNLKKSGSKSASHTTSKLPADQSKSAAKPAQKSAKTARSA